jgi:hypothetical protein
MQDKRDRTAAVPGASAEPDDVKRPLYHVLAMELLERSSVCDGETGLGHDPGNREDPVMSLGAILVIVLILVLLGVIPSWGYSSAWGYGPSGVVGTVLIIVIILLLLEQI